MDWTTWRRTLIDRYDKLLYVHSRGMYRYIELPQFWEPVQSRAAQSKQMYRCRAEWLVLWSCTKSPPELCRHFRDGFLGTCWYNIDKCFFLNRRDSPRRQMEMHPNFPIALIWIWLCKSTNVHELSGFVFHSGTDTGCQSSRVYIDAPSLLYRAVVACMVVIEVQL